MKIDFEEKLPKHGKPNKIIIRMKKSWAIFCGITVIMGFLGVGFLDFFNKDWQAIAEKKNNEALELYNSGEYEESIELYDYVISLEEKGIRDMNVTYFNRGMAYYKLQDYQHAIGDFTNAIEIKPESKYYLNRANAYGAIGDTTNEALDNAKALIGL